MVLERQIGNFAVAYEKGKISIDKAAKISGLTVSEMMDKIAKAGIKSDESIEEYVLGVKNLME